MSRTAFLEAVATHLPGAHNYIKLAYEEASMLLCQPLLFCLAIQTLITKMKSPLNVWYLDDGTLGGSAEEVLSDFNFLKQESMKIGLEINIGKSEIFCSTQSRFPQAPDNLKVLQDNDVLLLGGALTPASVETLEQKLNLLKHFQTRLRILPHHQALFLLKSSLGPVRLIHALRSSPCWKSNILQQMDDVVKETLEEILNVQFSQSKWLQATLPVGKGGLGVRRLTQLSIPAFIASTVGTAHLVEACLPPLYNQPTDGEDLKVAIDSWQQISQSAVLPESRHQNDCDRPVYEAEFVAISSSLSDTELSRLSAAPAKHSGDWLRTMPISKCGLALSNNELRISVCLRLGLPIFGSHMCTCGDLIDPLGQHCFVCKRNSGKHARHHAINQLIQRELSRCDIPSESEPSGLFAMNQLRPDGITTVPWSRGQQLIWDFTCTHSLSASNLRSTSGEIGKAAAMAEENKNRKYSPIPGHLIFTPIALETLGAYGPLATRFFSEVGKRQATVLGDLTAKHKLYQRVSIELQRGNARCIMFALKLKNDQDD